MENERYGTRISGKTMTFDFVSEGPKGLIPKRVQYSKIGRENIYNLAFGDLNLDTNTIDDKVISNNKDSLKVLSTVASTVYAFIKKYPKAIIYAEGSNATRTRLYRIGISNNLEELMGKFDVYGFLPNEGWTIFEKNTDYTAFFIKIKEQNNE